MTSKQIRKQALCILQKIPVLKKTRVDFIRLEPISKGATEPTICNNQDVDETGEQTNLPGTHEQFHRRGNQWGKVTKWARQENRQQTEEPWFGLPVTRRREGKSAGSCFPSTVKIQL